MKCISFRLATLLHLANAQQFPILDCFKPCANGYTGNEVIPGTGCKYYHECWKGRVSARTECGSPLLYDETKNYCNFPSEVICLLGPEYVQCPDANSPDDTEGNPSSSSTNNTESETQEGTPKPTSQPTSDAPTIDGGDTTMDYINSKRELIEEFVLVSYNNENFGQAYPSKSYTFESFIKALQTMAIDGFGADFKFDLWEGNGDRYIHGLVNLAAFLANSMVEAIEDDSCDELNWQETSGRYAISNSCGQEFRSYEDETCDMKDDMFSCDVRSDMEVTASSVSIDPRAPPPFQCKKRSNQFDYGGYWDATSGTLHTNSAYSNDLGRIYTDGCCWWGRGALMTRGVCNIGKVNYYLGKKGEDSGRNVLYPTIDFCQYPQSICDSDEMRWTIAFFEWAERVQRYYKQDEWIYEQKLADFVDTGMVDDSFINGASRILSRGCHTSDCSDSGDARMLDKRRSNFYLIINDIFDIESLLATQAPTRQPTIPRPITIQPTQQPVTPPPQSPPSRAPTKDQTDLPTYYYDELIGLEGNSASNVQKVGVPSLTVLLLAVYLLLLQ